MVEVNCAEERGAREDNLMAGKNSKGVDALYDHRIYYPTLADDEKLENLLSWLSEVPAYSFWKTIPTTHLSNLSRR